MTTAESRHCKNNCLRSLETLGLNFRQPTADGRENIEKQSGRGQNVESGDQAAAARISMLGMSR